ncbi:MAG TPA: ABC transporter permease [Bryobacteraceae bacterium]|nr:ABC transporter permease [Bryobacteraceae bacterium]
MTWWARSKTFAGAALGRRRMERDMDAEMRHHVASYTEDLVRRGIPREQAERQARIEFGHFEPLKEECRQARGLRLVDETGQDLRYALRMLRKSPGFAAVAVVTLALGIGANTSIFSIVDAWVLKPLPYPQGDQLVQVFSANKKQDWVGEVSPADVYDWRHANQAFEEICGWTTPEFAIQTGDRPEQVIGGRVNWEFFHMLRVTPVSGRDFLPQDDRPDAAPVALLSYEFWQTHFGGDASLRGRTIRVDGADVTVIGILPAGFHFALMGPAEIFMPLALSEQELKARRLLSLQVTARLKPGFTLPHATAYLDTMARRLAESYPETNTDRGVKVQSLADAIGEQGGNDRALVVFALVGCVLLVACGNVANLIVGRAVARQKEMAVRIALGAGRARVLRQLLTENLLLFLLASALSVLLAKWGVNWIAQSIPVTFRAYLPNMGRLEVDLPVLIYTLGIGLLTGLLFGFAPAFRCWRIDANRGLKESTSRLSTGAGGGRFRNCLIVSQVSLALVVLVASGLLVKGLVRMYSSDPGFNQHGLLTARVMLSNAKYEDSKRSDAFVSEVLNNIRALPGVTSAGAATFIPYSGSDGHTTYVVDERPTPPPGSLPFVSLDRVTPDYFSSTGIAVLRGRAFTEKDTADAAPVMIINQTMARRNWPHEDPVGRQIHWGAKLDRVATIVGVVRDTKGFSDTDTLEPQSFVPEHQQPGRSVMFTIRSASSGSVFSRDIERAVLAADKDQPVTSIRFMEDLMAEREAPFLIVGQVTALFSALTLFLAALGIYGVLAYSVAARRQEFGIRMALGAARRDLLGLVVGQGLKLAVAGLAIGLAAALAVTRFMASILYQVSPTDAATFLLISALLLAVAGLASYLPARRASNLDPTRALRYE